MRSLYLTLMLSKAEYARVRAMMTELNKRSVRDRPPFPLLLLGSHTGTLSAIAKPIAWAFTIWGSALYLWAGGLYLIQVRRVTRTIPPVPPRRSARPA